MQQHSKPHKYNALVAAAHVITSSSVSTKVKLEGSQLKWQARSSQFYDEVGEFRFGVNWLANGLSRVNLIAARTPNNVGDEPTAIDPNDKETTAAEKRAAEIVSYIAGGPAGQGQLLFGFGQLLPIGGFVWLVAEPSLSNPASDTYETWLTLDQQCVRNAERGDGYEIRESDKGWRPAHPNALIVKCWRKHPIRPWEPDAPVRAVLSVLDQIDLFTAHNSASGRSRLAGAGLVIFPSEATFPPPPASNTQAGADPGPAETETPQDPFDYFMDQVMEAMAISLKDRDNGSAVCPIGVQMPGEFIDKVKHLTFSTPFDAQADTLLQSAIKRLALGMDMPPEVLTGMSGVNHWNAWQIEDTAVTLHIEPNAEIVCNALTEGYLKAALEAEGLDADTAMVWYDTGDLTTPPDRSANVVLAYDRVEASGKALRDHLGLEEDDKPDDDEKLERILLGVAKGAPSLAPQMLDAAGLLPSGVADAVEPVEGGESPAVEPAEPEQPTELPPEAPPGAGMLLAACDGVVYRALERAGAKLRTQIGRKVDGGPQAIPAMSPETLHTHYDATIYADLDMLLDGAFVRTPEIADWLGVDSDALTSTLNAYCRALLAAQHEHSMGRLAVALGESVAVV